MLRTNTDYNFETVAHVYKSLCVVEDIIRTTKSILETRPIYHKRDETIRGHVFCSFLALLLKVELERRMQFADLECEWAQVLRGLEALQQVEATFEQKRFLLLESANQRSFSGSAGCWSRRTAYLARVAVIPRPAEMECKSLLAFLQVSHSK